MQSDTLERRNQRSLSTMSNDGALTERERLVYSAKLAEQAERYDGACEGRGEMAVDPRDGGGKMSRGLFLFSKKK